MLPATSAVMQMLEKDRFEIGMDSPSLLPGISGQDSRWLLSECPSQRDIRQ